MRKFLAPMADSGSIGFGFRLLHLSLFTFLYVSAAVLIAMQPAQVLDTFFVREAAAQLRTDPLCACVLRLLGGFSAFAGLAAGDRVAWREAVSTPSARRPATSRGCPGSRPGTRRRCPG